MESHPKAETFHFILHYAGLSVLISLMSTSWIMIIHDNKSPNQYRIAELDPLLSTENFSRLLPGKTIITVIIIIIIITNIITIIAGHHHHHHHHHHPDHHRDCQNTQSPSTASLWKSCVLYGSWGWPSMVGPGTFLLACMVGHCKFRRNWTT